MQIRELLEQVELFRGMGSRALERLQQTGRLGEHRSGEILFLEGSDGEAFYLLLEGTVRVFKTAPDGQELTVRLVQPGDIFGEVILFEDRTYPVSAVVMQNCRVLAIARRSFLDLLDERDVRDALFGNIMRKQRYLANRILYLTSYDVEERFFRFLLEQWGRQDSYEIEMSKKDLAGAIGTIPETFSRLIKRLRKQEIIRWEGRRLEVSPAYWDLLEYDDE